MHGKLRMVRGGMLLESSAVVALAAVRASAMSGSMRAMSSACSSASLVGKY